MSNVPQRIHDRTHAGRRATRSGTIAFGLVSIPFRAHKVQVREREPMRRLHAACGTPLRGSGASAICSRCAVVVDTRDSRETVRGYEIARDLYVRFTDDELKALETPRTDGLEVIEIVPDDTVTVVHIRRTEVLEPVAGGERGLALFVETLRRTASVAIGRFETRGDDRLVALRPHARRLLLHELFCADELRELGPELPRFDLKPVELDLADALVAQLRTPAFDPARYSRQAKHLRLLAAIEAKLEDRATHLPPTTEGTGKVIDLLDRLKAMANRREGA